MGKNYFIFAIFLRDPFLRRGLPQKLIFLLFFLRFGDWGCFILLLLQETVRTLDSDIAVHSYTGIQMSISWTLVLQSLAQTTSMIQIYRLFDKPVPNSCIILPMARKMLPCHFVSIIVHEMLKKCRKKLCGISQQEKSQHCTWL